MTAAEVLSVEPLHQGWSTFSLARFRLKDGAVVERFVEDHGHAVCVLPYDPVRRVALMVRQLRAPVRLAGEDEFPDPPAGILEPGEDPADCGRREVMEETGVRLSALEPLGCYWSSPGVTTEKTHLFLAEYGAADRVGDGGGTDWDEHVEALELPLSELTARLDRGELADVKLFGLVLSLMRRRPELFS